MPPRTRPKKQKGKKGTVFVCSPGSLNPAKPVLSDDLDSLKKAEEAVRRDDGHENVNHDESEEYFADGRYIFREPEDRRAIIREIIGSRGEDNGGRPVEVCEGALEKLASTGVREGRRFGKEVGEQIGRSTDIVTAERFS